MKTCYIFGSAEISDHTAIPNPTENDIVIAADGGLRHLKRFNLKPDYLIGDLDSCTEQIPPEIPLERYPSEKDDTDTSIAVNKGLSLQCDHFILYGCLGGALSHTIANLQLLIHLASIKKTAVLVDGSTEIYPLCNNAISFDETQKGKISIFSFSEKAEGVSISGLKYTLDDAVVTNQFAIGVSNEFIGKKSCISVKSGDLILILEKNV